MLDPKSQAANDQLAAWAGENMPTTWWEIYRGLLRKGFSPEQSFVLLQTFIASMFGKVVQLPNGPTGNATPGEGTAGGD